jgi:SAM-dependent methyltransferase
VTTDLEEIGACPSCRGDLVADTRAFVCRGCGARWPVIDGVPRFVASEHYVGSFGYQWRRHRKTMLASARRGDSEKEFREKTGLRPEDVAGKLVLDVGVGNARFAQIVAGWGGRVVGVDLSLAVLSAKKNLARTGGESLVAQADLFRLPLREGIFDVVYSIGVLHHTPSTRAAFRAIAPFVKPGGTAVVGIYEDFSRYFECSARYRRYTTAMSHSLLHLLSHAAIPAYEVLKLGRRALGATRASQLERALFIFMHEDPAWRVIGTFDWYSPHYQWLHDEREVKRWFEDLGFTDVARAAERNMVSVRGRRPSAGPLHDPGDSPEERAGELAPLPDWIPEAPLLRDAVLTSLLAGSVVRSLGELVWPSPSLRPLVTRAVVSAKRLAGIERELLSR